MVRRLGQACRWWLRTDWAIGLTVFLIALLPRVLAPAWQFSDPDAPAFWLPWIKEFAAGLRGEGIAHLAPAPHPGVPFLWLTGLMEVLLQATGWHWHFTNPLAAYLTLLKLPIMLATSGLAWLAWILIKRILPRPWAILAAVLFALDPLYLAYSRYLHLEALLAGFIWTGLLAIWIGARRPSRRMTVLGAVLLLLASLTRINGLIIFAAAALTYVFIYNGKPKQMWQTLGIAAAFCFAVAVILWPPLIFAPHRLLELQNLNLAMTLSAHEVPPNVDVTQPLRALYYPLFIFLREFPLVILLGLVGSLTALRKRSGSTRGFARFLIAMIVVYYVALLIEPKKLERYFLPVVGPMSALAALGAAQVVSWRPQRRQMVVIGLAVALIAEVALLWLHAPYFQTYENAFARRLKSSSIARSQAFNFSWGEGTKEAADYLLVQGHGRLPATAAWYAGNYCLYGWRPQADDYPFSRRAKVTCPPGLRLLATPRAAEYLVVSRDQITQRIYPQLIDDIIRLGWQPVHTIRLNGVPYLFIYRNLGGLRDHYDLSGS